MGRITKVFAAGTIGNVIFYERLGTACARSKPVSVKQTAATKQAGKLFGKAKTISSQLRASLTGILTNPKARAVMYLTDNAVATWLRNGVPEQSGELAAPLKGLEFSPKTSVYERFKKEIMVQWLANGIVEVSIPAFDPIQSIVAPANTTKVQLSLTITGCSVDGIYNQGSNITIMVDYEQGIIPANTLQLSFTKSAASIYLCVASLRYIVQQKGIKETITSEQWLPATVVNGFFMK